MDTEWIICQPVDKMHGEPETSSEHRWCSVCAATVWCAPTSMRFMEQHPKAQIVCNDCLPGLAAGQEDVKVLPVPGADTSQPWYRRAALAAWKHDLERRRRE
jgi:hypothetical protein